MNKNKVVKLQPKEEKFDARKRSRKDKSFANLQTPDDVIDEIRAMENTKLVSYKESQSYGGYEKIHRNTAFDKRLSGNDFKVLVCLCFNHNSKVTHDKLTEQEVDEGIAFPTQKQISESIGLSVATVNKSIKNLIKLGYLVVKNDNNKQTDANRYLVNVLVDSRFSKEERDVKNKINNFLNQEIEDDDLPF